MDKFCFVDHTADIAIKVFGESLRELFINASAAWREIVVGDSEVDQKERKEFEINADSIEELFVQFLSEINFLFLVKHWILGKTEFLSIKKESKNWTLRAVLKGEPFQPEKHNIQEEIKAVTFHQLKIEKVNDKFQTVVVFDT